MFRGRCLCGGTRHKIVGPVGSTLYCHCSNCRKFHGSTFRARPEVPMSSFRFVHGEALLTSNRSAADTIKRSCRVCGSAINNLWDPQPGRFGQAMGPLDEDSSVRPARHLLMSEGPPRGFGTTRRNGRYGPPCYRCEIATSNPAAANHILPFSRMISVSNSVSTANCFQCNDGLSAAHFPSCQTTCQHCRIKARWIVFISVLRIGRRTGVLLRSPPLLEFQPSHATFCTRLACRSHCTPPTSLVNAQRPACR